MSLLPTLAVFAGPTSQLFESTLDKSPKKASSDGLAGPNGEDAQ
jgi:hypothetical protein